jgi:hypothetical protein
MPQKTTIRYDFWSLIAALEVGLTHGSASASDRAQKIADALANLPLVERQAKEKSLGVVVRYLAAIEQELVTHQTIAAEVGKTASNIETVLLPPRNAR